MEVGMERGCIIASLPEDLHNVVICCSKEMATILETIGIGDAPQGGIKDTLSCQSEGERLLVFEIGRLRHLYDNLVQLRRAVVAISRVVNPDPFKE